MKETVLSLLEHKEEKIGKVLNEIKKSINGKGEGLELMQVSLDGTVKVKAANSYDLYSTPRWAIESAVKSILMQRLPEIKKVDFI